MNENLLIYSVHSVRYQQNVTKFYQQNAQNSSLDINIKISHCSFLQVSIRKRPSPGIKPKYYSIKPK
jgi:hypothetical protein